MGYRLGIDTGGTFTDLVLLDGDGTVELFKTPSTPDDPPAAIRNGLEAITERLGTPVNEFLGACDLVIHGTTVALNTLIQLRGAKVGLFCTRGHEDSLEIRNGHKEDGHRYDFRYPPAPMLVPQAAADSRQRARAERRLRTAPLDEDDVYRGIETFRREGVEAVGVSFLWSFLHPDHERRVGEILARELPDAHVTLSVDLLPQIREYTRTSTVAVNAYVAPSLARYVGSIESDADRARLREPDPLLPVERRTHLRAACSSRRAVSALNSGPAAGPSAASTSPRASTRPTSLTLDVGGTSSDISLVTRRQGRSRQGRRHRPLPRRLAARERDQHRRGRRFDRLDRRAGTAARRATERRGRPRACLLHARRNRRPP